MIIITKLIIGFFDSIVGAKSEFPVNVLVESSGTATFPPDTLILPAEELGFPETPNGSVRTLQPQLTGLKSNHFCMAGPVFYAGHDAIGAAPHSRKFAAPSTPEHIPMNLQ